MFLLIACQMISSLTRMYKLVDQWNMISENVGSQPGFLFAHEADIHHIWCHFARGDVSGYLRVANCGVMALDIVVAERCILLWRGEVLLASIVVHSL